VTGAGGRAGLGSCRRFLNQLKQPVDHECDAHYGGRPDVRHPRPAHSGMARIPAAGRGNLVRERTQMAAKFVLKRVSNGKFRFTLIATNGQVIATSEAYESKASALKGVESLKRNAPTAQLEDLSEKATAGVKATAGIGR
jgi:uncharacterized protein